MNWGLDICLRKIYGRSMQMQKMPLMPEMLFDAGQEQQMQQKFMNYRQWQKRSELNCPESSPVGLLRDYPTPSWKALTIKSAG